MSPEPPVPPGALPEDLLSAYVDGELDAGDRAVVEGALARSPALRDVLVEVTETRGLVRALPWPEPRPGFWADVADRMAAPPDAGSPGTVVPIDRRRSPAGWRRGVLAAGAAAAVVLVTGIAMVPSEDPREVRPAVPALVDAHAAVASTTSDPLTRLSPIGVPLSFEP